MTNNLNILQELFNEITKSTSSMTSISMNH